MYYKRKKKKKYYFLIPIVIVLVSFILVNTNIDYINNTFIGKGINDISLLFNNLFNSKKSVNSEEYQNALKKIEVLENTNKELKEQLDIPHTLSDYDYVTGTVINRDLNYWYDSITINKGKKDNIKSDMAVTYKGYLIGKVTKVTNNNSIIRLLTSNQSSNKVSVKIKVDNDYVYGLLSNYDKSTNYYKIEGISGNVNIPEDSISYTTGFSDIFPSDIEVGKLKKIVKDNFGLGYIIYIKPSVNVDDLDYVTVLIRK